VGWNLTEQTLAIEVIVEMDVLIFMDHIFTVNSIEKKNPRDM